MPDPLTILRSAVRAVPAVRYALGIAGIVSVIAIVKAFHLDLGLAAFGTLVMFVLMTMLVIFARLSKFGGVALQRPALVFTWFSLFLTMAAASFLFSSVFFGVPRLVFLRGTGPAEEVPGSTVPVEVYGSSPDLEAPSAVSLGLVSKNIFPRSDSLLSRANTKKESVLSRAEAEKFNDRLFSFSHYIEVSEIIKNSPAEKAGIQVGDVVQFVAERLIENSVDLAKVETTHKAGDEMEIVVLRAGREKTLNAIAEDAAHLFERACKRGDQAGCTNWGLLLYNGEGRPKEELPAQHLFQRACEHNYLRGCSSLAMALAKQRRYEEALPIAKDACSWGSMRACSLDAFMHENALGTEKDSNLAVKLVTTSCMAGDS